MLTKRIPPLLLLLLVLGMVATACGSTTDDVLADETEEDIAEEDIAEEDIAEEDIAEEDVAEAPAEEEAAAEDDHDETEAADTTTVSTNGVDTGLFFDGAIVGDVVTEACTLSGGEESTCYTFTVSGDPVSYDTGPFCPETITDTAEAGGIWFDGNAVYDLDGEFFTELAELYDDDNWLMYNEDGTINVTETAEEFDAAARPDVDEALQNHCVEGDVEFLEGGEPITSTVTIPAEPVLADGITNSNDNLGVTLDGIVIAQSAPVDAILSAYTIAAFDDCGGHYNPFEGYHLHGATGCSENGEVDADGSSIFAYAMDGFPVHSPLEDPDSVELDECNGHDTGDGYHYHANAAEENLVIACLIGQTVSTGDGGAGGGRAAGGERPEGPPPGADE